MPWWRPIKARSNARPASWRLHPDGLRQRNPARRGERGVQRAEICAVKCAPRSDRLAKIVARRLVRCEHRRCRGDVAVLESAELTQKSVDQLHERWTRA